MFSLVFLKNDRSEKIVILGGETADDARSIIINWILLCSFEPIYVRKEPEFESIRKVTWGWSGAPLNYMVATVESFHHQATP
jgi:hypothetical protein